MSEQFARSEVATCSVATLVHAAGDGNQEAWAELVRRFGGMIASVGRRYGLSQADIGELQQTTWLRLVENIHRLKQPERVGGWLATTASRQSLQLAKRSSRYSSGADHVLANLPDPSQPFDLELSPDSAECRALQRAWDQLKPRCRNLLSLLMAEEGVVGYKELSQLLDMPIGSIGPTRARCLDHLRHLLAEEGVTSYEG
jgi:RNA polymerase sigma factor (sigma-70 family)